MRSVILEIRPAAGGDEAKIWASDLLRMYLRFAQKQGWKTDILGDGVIKLSGPQVSQKLRYEAGVHRVQRVPETEKYGRIHTSTATVAVLPEIPKKVVKIDPKELDWQFFRASTQGGQHVQKVSTAVRLIHKPTGLTITCQTQRSQEQNRKTVLAMLRSKLWQLEEEKKKKVISQMRKVAVGSGMRAEKIRTYNFPQNRVTDHRVGKSWKILDKILDGNLNPILRTLQG